MDLTLKMLSYTEGERRLEEIRVGSTRMRWWWCHRPTRLRLHHGHMLVTIEVVREIGESGTRESDESWGKVPQQSG